MTRQLESAIALSSAGIRIFPAHGVSSAGKCTCGRAACKNAGKHPALKSWQTLATTDEETIRRWWEREPHMNPAIPTGRGVVVVDVDGEDGKRSLRLLEQKHGALPPTWTVNTGGGGYHYYFASDAELRNSAGKLGSHLDIRGEGGYVIAPGACHVSGNLYEWKKGCSPADISLADLPGWIVRELQMRRKVDSDFILEDEMICEGSRNRRLFEYGCFLRGKRGKTVPELTEELTRMNQEKCSPPLESTELEQIIRSVDRYPRGGGPESDFESLTPRGLICAADVEYRETEFVIKPYVPEGKLTIIQGNPGEGKTAFACALAAKVTSGESFLGIPCKKGNTLILSVEDDREELKMRIQENGGDLTRCFFVGEASILFFNSPEIEEYIKETRAKLVIFDPFQSFLGSKVDMHRANETRPVLAKLADVAARNECAIILICHMAKGLADTPAVLRSLGSIDIPGASRSIMQIGHVDDNPSQNLMVHVKCSNAAKGESVLFTIGNHAGISLDGFSEKDESNFYTCGKKVRQAAKDDFLYENILSACRDFLKEHPHGDYVLYSEFGFKFPNGVKPKPLLDTLSGRLKDNGITVGPYKKFPRGTGVWIGPDTSFLM